MTEYENTIAYLEGVAIAAEDQSRVKPKLADKLFLKALARDMLQARDLIKLNHYTIKNLNRERG